MTKGYFGGGATCPKCGVESGDAWAQCGGSCPMVQSPHYNQLEQEARKIAARKMGLVKDADGARLPDDLWRQCLPEAAWHAAHNTPEANEILDRALINSVLGQLGAGDDYIQRVTDDLVKFGRPRF